MLSIDEAIAFERQQAKDKRNEHYTFGIQKSKETAEEHEQLAEWLEELKSYRASVFSGDMTRKMLKEAYNKAIDDFVEYVWETTSSSDIEWITRDYELYDLLQKKAEQLKVGGENETI